MASLGSVLAALGICLVLVVPRRIAVLGGFALLAAAEALVADASGNHLTHLTSKRLPLAFVGLGVVGALAALLVQHPALVPPLTLAAAPFRLALHFGGSHVVSI